MTFTTPQCPMGDMIEQMTQNAILEVYPAWAVTLEITFDPLWTFVIVLNHITLVFDDVYL